jgi:ribonuclease G
MKKKIIINCDDRRTRVALLEDGKVAEVYLERPLHQRVVGNIYKGLVTSVLPGMQAAFVDIGLARNAFLYVDEAAALKGHEGAAHRPRRTIECLLRPGQEIMVQVVKEAFAGKGARLTRRITLPGRYLVLMPNAEYSGVSRRIVNSAERERLKELLAEMRPAAMGLIARTVSEGQEDNALRQDLQFLLSLWENIQSRNRQKQTPQLLYQDLDLIFRIIRDLFSDQVEQLLVDRSSEYRRILDLLECLAPALADRVSLYTGKEPVFEVFGVEREIERALSRVVWLACGGYLVFDHTEALTVIDVNTGKYTGKTSQADTILKTNLQAAVEIIRQVRLRNLGGIIIIDFIDMKVEEHRQQVLSVLAGELKKDRTRAQIVGLTGLGLVEMTRKKALQGLGGLLQQPCPYCSGSGRILSGEAAAAKIAAEIKGLLEGLQEEAVLLEMHPQVAAALREPGGATLRSLEAETGKSILIQTSETIHIEKFRLVASGDAASLALLSASAAEGQPVVSGEAAYHRE